MKNSFFAMLSRIKHISRWALMRNTRTENLAEHTLETAYIAHALCAIGAARLGRTPDTGAVVLAALYHDCGEILTGDMPTPVKYYNPSITAAYKDIENSARKKLSQMLPDDLRPHYAALNPESVDEYARLIVRAADKISALIKCIDEEKAGNHEFATAKKAILKQIEALGLKEAEIFISDFLPSYSLTLDELE